MRDRLIGLIRKSSHELTSRCVGDCGNCAYCPADRFTIVFEEGGAE